MDKFIITTVGNQIERIVEFKCVIDNFAADTQILKLDEVWLVRYTRRVDSFNLRKRELAVEISNRIGKLHGQTVEEFQAAIEKAWVRYFKVALHNAELTDKSYDFSSQDIKLHVVADHRDMAEKFKHAVSNSQKLPSLELIGALKLQYPGLTQIPLHNGYNEEFIEMIKI